MTEPSGRSRRDGRPSDVYKPLGGLPRPVLAVGALAIIVILAVALSIALGGGLPGPGGAPSPVQSLGIALGTPTQADGPGSPPAANTASLASPSPSAGGSPAPSLASASPAATAPGLRANRIQIARLHIDLAIVEGDGIDAPIGKAAHFPGTGWPDGGTNIYIYAHARVGMFLPLWDAVVGDRVVLILVDGSKRSYVVDRVLPHVPPDAVDYLQPTPAEQLTLQTSTGPTENDPRFVVIAHPAP